jgi:hypothetical protein
VRLILLIILLVSNSCSTEAKPRPTEPRIIIPPPTDTSENEPSYDDFDLMVRKTNDPDEYIAFLIRLLDARKWRDRDLASRKLLEEDKAHIKCVLSRDEFKEMSPEQSMRVQVLFNKFRDLEEMRKNWEKGGWFAVPAWAEDRFFQDVKEREP